MGKSKKIWFQRNEDAEALEAAGREDDALALYQANVAEGCNLAFTYQRLAAIYHRRQQYDDELASLEKLQEIEQERGPTNQLVRVQRKLEAAREIVQREQGRSRHQSERGDGTTLVRDRAVAEKKSGCLSVVAVLAFVCSAMALLF